MYGVPWTEEETKQLIELQKQEKTLTEVAAIMGFGTERVKHKCKVLGIRLRPAREWVKSDIQRLKRLAAKNLTAAEIGKILGRTSGSVDKMARNHGIYVICDSESSEPSVNSGKPWTTGDDKKLKTTLYETCSVEETAKVLGRSVSSVRVRMVALNLYLREAKKAKAEDKG